MNIPKNYWDKVAEKGAYQMGTQKYRLFLLDFLKKYNVKTILDVGCGTGPLYEIIMNAPLGKYLPISEYKGVDYSENMIAVAQSKFPEGDFEVQDARILKEDDNSWDAVILLHSLDHLDDYQAAIKEASRVAKQYVLIVLWRPMAQTNENNLNSHNDLEREEGEWEDTHLQEYNFEKLVNAFEEANLKIENDIADERINNPGSFNRLFLLKKL